MKLNIAVCDDNQHELKNEAKILRNVLEDLNYEYSLNLFSSPLLLVDSIEQFNLLILDVEMENMNGIELAKRAEVKNKQCLIFFLTNYENYMDEALNRRPFRFWTKPLDRSRLKYGLESVVEELTALEQYVTVVVNNQKIQIPLRNIIYIYTQQRKLHIFTLGGEIVSNDTFEKIYAQMKDNRDFYTPHRSYMVNFRHVNNYSKNIIYCECLGENHQVYLSRRKYADFIKTFMQWLGEK